MAKSKKIGASVKAELSEWARGFALLSDPTRLGILKMLADGPQNVTALCDALGLKQPTISHHLGLLRMGRLVTGTRKGKSVVYTSEKKNLKDLAAGIAKLMPSK
ncbi:MAG: winged helix-turn-helix transcriptional regulator [Planctomycetes bacterium]|nr:winged helix-turn-helix transcriptional regulator [Planctomycetota bacterium]